jgi:hypothetical protein
MEYNASREREEALHKRILDLDKKVMRVWYIFLAIGLAVCLLAIHLAENQLCYTVYETKTKTEPYEYKIGEVWTYECYTTRTGECYHAECCQYLKSKRETTVYEAERAGYRACSRCEPDKAKLLKLTETRYREVEYQEEIIKKPRLLLCAIGLFPVVAGYYIVSAPAKKKHKEALDELDTFRGYK